MPPTASAAPLDTSTSEVPVRHGRAVASRSAPPRVSRKPAPVSSRSRSPDPFPTQWVPDRLRSGPERGPQRVGRRGHPDEIVGRAAAAAYRLEERPPVSDRLPGLDQGQGGEVRVLEWSETKGPRGGGEGTGDVHDFIGDRDRAAGRAGDAGAEGARGRGRHVEESPVTVVIWLFQVCIGAGAGGAGRGAAGVAGATGEAAGACGRAPYSPPGLGDRPRAPQAPRSHPPSHRPRSAWPGAPPSPAPAR